MATKRMSFRLQAMIAVITTLLVTSLALGITLRRQSRNAMKQLIDDHVLDIVNTAAAMLDGDALETITADAQGTPEYNQIYKTLSFFEKNIGLEFIYVTRATDDGSYMFVIDPATENASAYGDPVHDTEALYEAGKGLPAVDSKPYRDEFGYFYSAYSPVFNSAGEVAGVVAADFNAGWYEKQIDKNSLTIVASCVLFTIMAAFITMLVTRQYSQQLDAINESMRDLARDLDTMTKELTEDSNAQTLSIEEYDDSHGDSMQVLVARITSLRDSLREYVTHATTQANSMITAMASDYRSVYHVNLDDNDGVCYRSDPHDNVQSPEGVHFPYLERFTWYANNVVAENYREGFLSFIEPDTIRKALATQPIIGYRYLAQRDGREYYEMIRMAGVRRAEDRDDGIVHAIGLGLSVIDAEMRETLARNEALAEALAMADEANMAKTAFLSNMSHEIRTPMNAIIGLNTLALQDQTLTDQTRVYLEMFANSEPGTYDAILMDVRMPIMDGLEAASAIRALKRPDAERIPIIALTANAFDEDVQQSLQAGMNAHLTKPVESEHLCQTLGELIYEAERG